MKELSVEDEAAAAPAAAQEMRLILSGQRPASARVLVAGPARRLDGDRWLRRALASQESDEPPRLQGTWERETDTGWPMRLRVFRLGPDESAVVADYQFFDLRAHVLVSGLRDIDLEKHGDDLIDGLATARPDWNAEPVVVSHLWCNH